MLHFAGSATEGQVQALRGLAPPLVDGLEDLVKTDGVVAKDAAARVVKVDAACARVWGAGQTCVEGTPVVAKRRGR
jgi:hypothetical protein